jgi:glycosyltransferase involved in cell wall biosynthesis
MKLSVILPARNEEQLIGATLKNIYRYLLSKKYPFEIIVVCNDSTDKTEEIVKAFSQNKPAVKMFRSELGYGYALRKGMVEAKGDYVAVFNVDFYDLRLLDLIDIDLNGRDLIIGSKMTPWAEDRRPYKRRVVARLFNLYLKIVYGFRGSDTHGIKIFSRRVLTAIYPRCKTFTGIFDTEFVLRAERAGFKIADFPVVLEEKRSSRFANRFLNTPIDIIKLYKALK